MLLYRVMITLVLSILYAAYVGVSIFFAVRLMRSFRLFSMKSLVTDARHLNELPSVSVCIPARNETHAMTQCLESVIASRYPKLEIIVLDDESADNTSYLIRSFAHAGVRFVAGSPLPDGWLGKNHALQTLLREASGSYVLYMDVDTQIEPDTIGQLVAYVHQTGSKMVSVAPMRFDALRSSVAFSTLRYFWEILLHTRHHPATASAAWMIHRTTLQDTLGGFNGYREDVQPEVSIASALAKTHAYRFLISSRLLGVHFEKKWSSQCETSRRLLYPKFANLKGGVVSGVALYVVLLSPLFALLTAFISGWTGLHILFVLHTMVFMVLYALYARRTWRKGWWLAFFVWPIIIVQDVILFVMGWIGYATNTITWKGRPIRRSITAQSKV